MRIQRRPAKNIATALLLTCNLCSADISMYATMNSIVIVSATAISASSFSANKVLNVPQKGRHFNSKIAGYHRPLRAPANSFYYLFYRRKSKIINQSARHAVKTNPVRSSYYPFRKRAVSSGGVVITAKSVPSSKPALTWCGILGTSSMWRWKSVPRGP